MFESKLCGLCTSDAALVSDSPEYTTSGEFDMLGWHFWRVEQHNLNWSCCLWLLGSGYLSYPYPVDLYSGNSISICLQQSTVILDGWFS